MTRLLDLISTPVAVLNSLDLNLRIGLSSEDPMVGRNEPESYEAFLSLYSAEGILVKRDHLGKIEPRTRRFFDISGMTQSSFGNLDHLCVVHRIPSRLINDGDNLEDSIECNEDYSLFRATVEYSYTGGGNGSVIYDTPPNLNATLPNIRTSNTLTLSCQTVLSDTLNTVVVLIHYSVDDSYSRISEYSYAFYSLSGELVFSDRVKISPFSCKVLDLANLIPYELVQKHRDTADGFTTFNLVGYSNDAVIMPVILNVAPSLGAVSLEHTHPPVAYMIAKDASYPRSVKSKAQQIWGNIMDGWGDR